MSERDEAEVDETAESGEGETSAATASDESKGSDDVGEGAEVPTPEGEPAEPREATDEAPADETEPVEEDPMVALQARYDEAQARLRTVSKAYTDLQKEMKAFRERMEARSKVNSELQAFDQARRFFDPVMNLKRSLQQPEIDLETLRQGLTMVQSQFMDAMEKLGLEEVPGEGSLFDPNVHEALAVTPVTDPAQDGKVLMVHTAGYTVKGKVLQAAQVVIGKHQEPAGEA